MRLDVRRQQVDSGSALQRAVLVLDDHLARVPLGHLKVPLPEALLDDKPQSFRILRPLHLGFDAPPMQPSRVLAGVGDGVKRGYTSVRRDENARKPRARIRDAASDLFVRQGYVATSVRQIADAAGVGVRTVFAVYIDGKAQLFSEALDVALESTAELGARGAIAAVVLSLRELER
jgi:hypothetical protein